MLSINPLTLESIAVGLRISRSLFAGLWEFFASLVDAESFLLVGVELVFPEVLAVASRDENSGVRAFLSDRSDLAERTVDLRTFWA